MFTSLLSLVASESLRLYVRTNLSLVSERDEWTETSGAALFKAHLLARFLLSSELHKTMQLTKTYIEKKIEVGRSRKEEVAAADSCVGGVEHATCARHHQAFGDFQASAMPKLPVEKSRLC